MFSQLKHNIILQVARLERVCAACWRSANREVQRQRRHDANRPVLQEIHQSTDEPGPEIPTPPPLPPHSHAQPSAAPLPNITSANIDVSQVHQDIACFRSVNNRNAYCCQKQ